MSNEQPVVSNPPVVAVNQIAKDAERAMIEMRKKTYGMRPERRERLAKIRTLYYVNKWSQGEIAKSLNLSVITVAKDIAKIKEIAYDEGTTEVALKKDVVNLFTEIKTNYERRYKLLWNDYNASRNEYVRCKLMSELRAHEHYYLTQLQNCGIINKTPEQTQSVGIVYVSHLGKEYKPQETSKKEAKMIREDEKNDEENAVMSADL